MYGQKKLTVNNNNVNHNNDNNDYRAQNGSVIDKTMKDQINKTIRGDVSQWSEAKYGREKRVKDRQVKRDIMAQVSLGVSEEIVQFSNQ